MWKFLQPPSPKEPLPQGQLDAAYRRRRLQVFLGIFIGYAGYYLIRKNFSFVIPDLEAQGFSKVALGAAMSAISIAYAFSKFLMGNLSDRSNARVFLPLGLVLSAAVVLILGLSKLALASMAVIAILLFLNGWFQGMGWPPSGRVMVHWFSHRERGFKMSIWNVAHNVGGGLVGPLAIAGVAIFGAWEAKLYFPALIAILVAIVAWLLIRDTPQSVGLPSIEVWKNDAPKQYGAHSEKEFSAREIFLKYVLNNKLLWMIAIANVFVYTVRYGVLNWAPAFLEQAKGMSLSETGWAYFLYEWAGIPGTLLCGWISDRLFNGRRAPTIILFMSFVLVGVLMYWLNPPGHIAVDSIALIIIGFFIYGPVMLIGVQALDLAPKKAAGTAAGLTGMFGYAGDVLLANLLIAYVVQKVDWDSAFYILIASCLLSILFTAFTWRREKQLQRA